MLRGSPEPKIQRGLVHDYCCTVQRATFELVLTQAPSPHHVLVAHVVSVLQYGTVTETNAHGKNVMWGRSWSSHYCTERKGHHRVLLVDVVVEQDKVPDALTRAQRLQKLEVARTQKPGPRTQSPGQEPKYPGPIPPDPDQEPNTGPITQRPIVVAHLNPVLRAN